LSGISILGVANVSKKFGGVTAVQDMSLDVPRGGILSIIGPNGAGKTSLLNMISGFYKPDTGQIVLEGQDITQKKPSDIAALGVARTFQNIALFSGFFIAFAIKAPLWPFHTWLPDAGAEAPVGTAVLLVGVVDKVGTFGFLRYCLPLFPDASRILAPYVLALCVIGVLYGALLAMGQKDMKRLVSYTSVSHFGFIGLGVFAFTSQAQTGAVLYMVSHGLSTGALFLVVGFLIARGRTRLIGDYGGVGSIAPIMSGAFLVAGLSSLALPGLVTFVSEFLVLLGTFPTYPVASVLATLGIILAALYILLMYQRTMQGPLRLPAGLVPPEGYAPVDDVEGVHEGDVAESSGRGTGEGVDRTPEGDLGPQAGGGVATAVRPATRTTGRRFVDLQGREVLAVAPLIALMLLLGFYPKPLTDVIAPAVEATLQDVGREDPAPTQGSAANGEED